MSLALLDLINFDMLLKLPFKIGIVGYDFLFHYVTYGLGVFQSFLPLLDHSSTTGLELVEPVEKRLFLLEGVFDWSLNFLRCPKRISDLL